MNTASKAAFLPKPALQHVVNVNGLAKQYNRTTALNEISFSVQPGEILGLIGPDGAGKTTLFQILAGIMSADKGEVTILDHDVSQVRNLIGYLTQDFSLYPDLTVTENLRYIGELRRIDSSEIYQRGQHYLTLFDMNQFSDRLASQLSGGMKQKLALCCALISNPKLLLLDEPTTGVDPVSRREFWDALIQLSISGITIIVATPYLDEAERCTRIALMNDGRILEIGTSSQLRQLSGLKRLEDTFVTILREINGEPQIPDFTFYSSQNESYSDQIAIEAKDLTKKYDDFQAVKNINLEIKNGEIYGLLGANGAGKTTTIKMLTGLLEQTSGIIRLSGDEKIRSASARQRIGYMSQQHSLYDDLTIDENLEFFAGIYNISSSEREQKRRWVLSMAGLSGKGSTLVADLPGGWKQRIAFGAAIMHEPNVLFLDEPTSGIDPLARRACWQLINQLADRGVAILITTHHLEEAEQCDRIGFMVAGELVAQGTPNSIKAAQNGHLIELITDQPQLACHILKHEIGNWRVALFGQRLHIVIDSEPTAGIERIKQRLTSERIQLLQAYEEPFSLEDIFIGIIERSRRN